MRSTTVCRCPTSGAARGHAFPERHLSRLIGRPAPRIYTALAVSGPRPGDPTSCPTSTDETGTAQAHEPLN